MELYLYNIIYCLKLNFVLFLLLRGRRTSTTDKYEGVQDMHSLTLRKNDN